MNDSYDWLGEHIRRKTLAELRKKQGLGYKDAASNFSNDHHSPANDQMIEPSSQQIHRRFQDSPDVGKPTLGMMLMGIMLTLTSIVLVSLCFVTTVDSYDMAVNATDHMNVNSVNNGGDYYATARPRPPMINHMNVGLLRNQAFLHNQRFHANHPRITANHFNRPHVQRLNKKFSLHG